jgi:hypothetical protein
MNYLITPPVTHYDFGLGRAAMNFRQAADSLETHFKSMDGALPECYLRRHSIELFLKSLIFILHKKFEIPFGEGLSLERPGIRVNEKWVSLDKTHNIVDLYFYFESVYIENGPQLPPEINWEIPPDVSAKINLIGGIDPKSTYFRYPKSSNEVQDAKKSGIQKANLDDLFAKSQISGKPVKCTVMLDADDNLIQTYDMDHDVLPDARKALKDIAEFLSNMHAAFRFKLTHGS